MHVNDAYVCGISGRNSFKGGVKCETPENPNCRKNGKTVILVEKSKFF